jgi:ferric-dicitrate binding protein FerR (iron transport regulator)
MEHKEYSVQNLLKNASFKRMVKGIATSEEVEFWNNWIEEDEENRLKAREATSKIVGFEFYSPEIPDLEKQWQTLQKKTDRKRLLKSKRVEYSNGSNEDMLKWIFRAVAIVLITVFVGLGGFYFYDGDNSATHLQNLVQEKTISTDDGEQKTLTFSNGSQIVLNSNSKITYRLGVFGDETIDVTLEGEAWFDVESSASGGQPAFAVRTPDGIIRDIGTEFLVSIQHNHSRVVIQEGIVEVEPVNQQLQESLSKNDSFRAIQGEMVEFNRANIISREKVNPTLFTSWATGYMELNETGLQEFSNYIENRFGVQVVLNDSGLENIKLNGTVYFRSLDELVRSVSEVTGIPAYRSADTNQVYIGELHETTNN